VNDEKYRTLVHSSSTFL